MKLGLTVCSAQTGETPSALPETFKITVSLGTAWLEVVETAEMQWRENTLVKLKGRRGAGITPQDSLMEDTLHHIKHLSPSAFRC